MGISKFMTSESELIVREYLSLVDKKRETSMNIEKLGKAGFNGIFISVVRVDIASRL
jgi:hypothetical protein